MSENKNEIQIEAKGKKNLLQFLQFCLVGLSNTIVCQIVYMIFVFLGCNYLIANLFGYAISVLNAFFWSNKYVFKESEDKQARVWWRVLLKTYAAYAFGFVVTSALLVFWMEIVHLEKPVALLFEQISFLNKLGMTPLECAKVIAPILNLLVTIPLNFVTNKFWAYRQKKEKK